MIKRLVFFILLYLFNSGHVAAQANADGAAIYRELLTQNLLEDYFNDSVAEIAGTIVAASGRWPGVLVNKPYNPGMVNLYLINSARLTDPNILTRFGVEAPIDSLDGNAMAIEDAQIVIVDTVLLKSLVTAALLKTNFNMDTMKAVAAIKARGIDAFRQFWDPNVTPALTTAGYADNWVMLASGAFAFVFAHELGHIAIGKQDVVRRTPGRFSGKEDRDKHWACSDLIAKKFQQEQAIEKKADDYAVSLLGKVLFPPGTLTKPLLRYELGARWYIVYGIATQMVKALDASESPNIHAALKLNFGPEIYNELLARKQHEGSGSVQEFFPGSHPAYIRRAADSVNRLAQSPYSSYQGGGGTEQDILMFEMFLGMECRNLKTKEAG